MGEGLLTARLGGAILAAGGVLFFIGSNLHPHDDGADYAQSTAAQLANPAWSPAHWVILFGGLCIVWAVWMLLDSAWRERTAAVQAGARLTIMAGLFMVVQWAIELAMPSARAALVADGAAPMVALSAYMHVVGFPALMLGLLLLITGLAGSAPAIVRIIGAIGAVAMGLAGPVVDGFHWLALGPLYMGAMPLGFWIIWTGAVIAFRRPATVSAANV